MRHWTERGPRLRSGAGSADSTADPRHQATVAAAAGRDRMGGSPAVTTLVRVLGGLEDASLIHDAIRLTSPYAV